MRKLSKNQAINKKANELIDKYGWSLRKGRHHRVLVDPNSNCSYPIPDTPSCYRAEKNWLAGIRRLQSVNQV